MADEQRDSDITEWNMNGKLLTFKKKYDHMNHAVTYRLEEATASVYLGTWEYGDDVVVAVGEAHLIITPIPEGFSERMTLFDGVR